MAINNYGTLKTAIANWLGRQDLTDRLPEFVALGIATCNAVVRSSRGVSYDTITLNQGDRYVTAPTTMLEPVFLTNNTDEDKPLEQVSIQQLGATRRNMTSQGAPAFYAISGRRIEVCPTPSAQVTLELTHYAELGALSADSDTNWLLTYRPDILLYACLMHAWVYLKDEQKVALSQNMVVQQLQAALEQQRTIQFDSKEAGPTLSAPRDVKKPAQ